MQKQIYYIEGCQKPQVGDMVDGDQVIVDVTWGQQVPSHPHDGDTWEITLTTKHFCSACSQRQGKNPCMGMLAFGYKWHNTPVGEKDDTEGAEFVVPQNPGECSWYSFLPKSPVVVNIDVATGIHIGETLSK